MQCFHVLVHGRLRWAAKAPDGDQSVGQPAGFFCHRYVFASDAASASDKAFESVTTNLEAQTGWLGDKTASLTLEAEDVSRVSLVRGFLNANRGHTFYDHD